MALTRQEVSDKIIAIVADVLKIDPKTITPETSLSSLGADSLDLMELFMKIEEAFEITIPEEALTHIDTVQQAADAIMSISNN